MKGSLSVLLFLSSSVLMSCVGEIGDPAGTDAGDPGSDYRVPVWVQPHPDLDPDDVVAGCDVWAAVGVSCTATTDAAAPIRVYASDAPCIPDTEGHVVLATAYGDGIIVFENRCLARDLIGRVDRQEFATVFGHELGHELGIWEHVPASCDEPHLTHPRSGPVCGRALMNPFYDPGVDVLMVPDALAFDLRSPDAPAFPPYRFPPHANGEAVCTYVAP